MSHLGSTLHLPDLAPAAALLEAGDDYLVTSHINSDGDGIGACLAVAHLLRLRGKRARVVLQDVPDDPLEFLTGWDDIEEAAAPAGPPVPCAVVLDCPNLERIGRVREHLGPDTRILNVDHHQDNTRFGEVNLVSPEVSSTSEFLYHLFCSMGVELDCELAEDLYTGLIYDTGAFRYSLATATSLEVGAALVRAGARLDFIADQLYNRCAFGAVKVIGLAIDSLQIFGDGRIALMQLDHEQVQVGDAEEAVNYGLMVKGVEVSAILKEEEVGRIRVSLRARDAVDVREVAAAFGGGGHARASGCRIPGDLATVWRVVLEKLEEAVKGGG
ncbi:MAG: DHH family phosphoesterase [Gemmatimonadota bacterium]